MLITLFYHEKVLYFLGAYNIWHYFWYQTEHHIKHTFLAFFKMQRHVYMYFLLYFYVCIICVYMSVYICASKTVLKKSILIFFDWHVYTMLCYKRKSCNNLLWSLENLENLLMQMKMKTVLFNLVVKRYASGLLEYLFYLCCLWKMNTISFEADQTESRN